MKTVWIAVISLAVVSFSRVSASESFVIVDNQTGVVLGSKERDEKRQVGSLTKIATAMVVLDWARLKNQNLGQMVPVPPEALNAGGINPVGLQAGDMMSLRDLLYCALIASDNVAATALAYNIGSQLPNAHALDPVGNFVANMNALAKTLGMKRTLFLNPSGFDGYADNKALPYSTASDLARLTQYAYSEPDFPFFVSQKSRTVHITRAGAGMSFDLQNTNELLGQDDIDGAKTGRTSHAGDCVILTADQAPEVQRDGEKVLVTPRRIIVVVLASPDRFGEGLSLIRQGWAAYNKWAAEGRKVKGQKL